MPRRILVVDDDPTLLTAIVRLLRSCDHSAEGCDSAENALARLAESTYDVLLTDYVMAGRSGLDLIADACRTRPALRAVVMSGSPRVEGLSTELTWLPKPLDIDLLLDVIEGS